MLPTAYVDARTTKFYFREFFSRPQSSQVEKLLRSFRRNGCSCAKQQSYKKHAQRRNAGWLAAFALLAQASYHRAADVAEADDQTGLASGSSPTWACQEIARGVYSTAVPTPPRVALQGLWRPFPAVNDWCVLMTLTWPWWSLGGLLAGARRIGPSPKKEVLVFVVTPKQGRWSLNSKCRRPTALPTLWGLGRSSTKRRIPYRPGFKHQLMFPDVTV